MQTVNYPLDELNKFMIDVFRGMGCPLQDAEICADVLNAADRRGIDSHGIGRLKPIYYDRVMDWKIQNAVTNIVVERDIAATAVLDGNNGMGMVISKTAMDMAIEKARQYGIGMVITKNSSHYGIAAYYPMMAADEGMIGITGTNARPSVAPTFGVKNMLGTNPMVFAMPTDEEFHFTNDYATSTAQRGRIEQYAREDKPLLEGWVIDQNGESLLDAKKALEELTAGRAALAPLGGFLEETGSHKGYGYATVVELMSAALQQGPFLTQLAGTENGKKVPIPLGHFFIAIDIAHFTELDGFKKHAGDILRSLRNSKKSPKAERIWTHGEKEFVREQDRVKTGVPLPPLVQKQMIEMRDELGLTSYSFPWE